MRRKTVSFLSRDWSALAKVVILTVRKLRVSLVKFGLYVSPRCEDSSRDWPVRITLYQFWPVWSGRIRIGRFSVRTIIIFLILFLMKHTFMIMILGPRIPWVIAIDRSSDRSSDLKTFFAPINMLLLKCSVLTYILCSILRCLSLPGKPSLGWKILSRSLCAQNFIYEIQKFMNSKWMPT